MPYVEKSKHLDRTTGAHNDRLLEIARHVITRSPDINDMVALNVEVRDVKEKEFVGLVFNRYVKDSLRSRWDDLENKQTMMQEDILQMKTNLHENNRRTKSCVREAAKDRVQILLLGSRIRQLEGLAFNLDSYYSELKEMVEFYRPYKLFMKQCADRMQFQSEMQIIDRFKTLSIIKQEMVDAQVSSFVKLEQQREMLVKVKKQNEQIHLDIASNMSTLLDKYTNLEKTNSEFETALSKVIAEASDSARSTFRMASGIRKLYLTILAYRGQESSTFDPFEMLAVIQRRLVNLTTAIADIYRVQEAETRENSLQITHFSQTDLKINPKTDEENNRVKPKRKKNARSHLKSVSNKSLDRQGDTKLDKFRGIAKKQVRIASENSRDVKTWSDLASTTASSKRSSDKDSSSSSASRSRPNRNNNRLPPIQAANTSGNCDNQKIDNGTTLCKKATSNTHQKIPMHKSGLNSKIGFPKINNSSTGALQRSSLSVTRNASSLTGSSHNTKLNCDSKISSSNGNAKRSRLSVDRHTSSLTGSSHRSRLIVDNKVSSSTEAPQRSRLTAERKVQVQWK